MMITVIVAATFIAGVIVGAIALICASITREDDDKSLMLRPRRRASPAAADRRLARQHSGRPIPLHRMAQPTAARSSRDTPDRSPPRQLDRPPWPEPPTPSRRTVLGQGRPRRRHPDTARRLGRCRCAAT